MSIMPTRWRAAAALVLTIPSASAVANVVRIGPGAAYAEMRWVERSGQTHVPAGALPGSLNANDPNDATIWLVLECRLVSNGSSGLFGIGGIEADVLTDDLRTRGDWKATPQGRNASPATSLSSPSHNFPTAMPSHRGTFSPFRFLANLNEATTGVLDGSPLPSFANITDIAILTAGGEFAPLVDGLAEPTSYGLDEWIPIYTFQYDFTDLTPRDVTFRFARHFTETVGAVAMTGLNESLIPTVVPVPVLEVATFTVHVGIPTPGALSLLAIGLGRLTIRRR